MTSQEFRDLLERQSDLQLLEPCLSDDRAPYVFQQKPPSWDTFRDELVSGLHVSRNDIRIVGTARFGFGIKSGFNVKSFSDNSDIDVVIVDANRFEQLWVPLLDAAYPKPLVTNVLGGWLQARSDDLY